jgi:hypothetical protein
MFGAKITGEEANMKVLVFLLAFASITFVSVFAIPTSSKSRAAEEHTEWIAKSLTEMESIQVGMTRADLLKVFREEGGLSTRTERRYAYRDCPYIKVDVEFELVGEPPANLNESPKDKIIKISRPFLERPILD